jgi:hypothetical protein
VSRFRFIAAERANHRVSVRCRILGVSRSGYYAWTRRPISTRRRTDAQLMAGIRRAHAMSRGTYGARRIHAELRADGAKHGRKCIARLIRASGLEGVHRRRFRRTMIDDALAVPAPDLVGRDFTAEHPNQLWVGDITYIRTWAGWLYVAAVVDAPEMARHAVHLLQHGLLHLDGTLGGDHLRRALHRVVGRRRIDAEFGADLPINLGGTYLFSTSFVEGPPVFGQGAEMQVRKFEVRSRVAGTNDGDRHGDQPI